MIPFQWYNNFNIERFSRVGRIPHVLVVCAIAPRNGDDKFNVFKPYTRVENFLLNNKISISLIIILA